MAAIALGLRAVPALPRILALCLAEARPLVLAVSLLRFLSGVALALPVAAAPDPPAVLRGAAAWVLSIFAVYLFNGVTDVTEDRINGSGRPIARGDLTPRTAAAVAAAGAGLAMLATVGLPEPMAWIVAGNLVLGYLYSGPPLQLKGSAGGTVAVLCLSGLLSYLGGFVVVTAGGTGVAVPPGLAVFAAAAIGWMVLVGVPAKDLSDIEGDAAAGRRTFGVLVGERGARLAMAAASLALCVALGAAVWWLGAPLLGVFVAMAAGSAGVVAAARRRRAEKGRRSLRRPYGVFMGTQHVVHLTAVVCAI
ncbi:UbiA family prenyltransferase [Planomonospora venezuelensis]|uniref:4-hydroxybenzoate polyprenyltransferase n=1 Tax=Planomonospora venezuelensis TaxID=1999 RepID=A0A841D0M3_PLAVE|nr:UbiA family prenyltransferase [Planomonospora venezuelensis]MBB5961938.1 4-hydroxybenzoate polyprenyltransferase [Planomonospora venezuelensis]GIM98962.1 homogentisate phytyltransferase [Planomonospora venezuelensis]